MENGKKTSLFYKIFSLLSVVRGYNILVLVIAQYLASIYIFSPKKSIPSVLFDLHLFFVVFATVCVVAGGYIINNFYDIKADKINRPNKQTHKHTQPNKQTHTNKHTHKQTNKQAHALKQTNK